MATGCAWDLTGFGKNLDASGGLVANVMIAGEKKYTGNGAAGVATQIYPREPGVLAAISGVSEDGALVEWRLRRVDDPNYHRSHMFQTGQTEGGPLDRLLARVNDPLLKGDKIECAITNAAAKMDAILMWIGKGGTYPQLSAQPFGPIPPGTKIVSCTMATTATADTWTEGTISFENFNLKTDKKYKVLGAAAYGATLYAIRFRPLAGDDSENMPGILGGDTDQINVPTWFSHPFEFEGLSGLNGEILCSAGDTATVISLWIVEV